MKKEDQSKEKKEVTDKSRKYARRDKTLPEKVAPVKTEAKNTDGENIIYKKPPFKRPHPGLPLPGENEGHPLPDEKENCPLDEGCPRHCRTAAAFILAAGIALGGFFPGYYYYQSKINANSVTVKGLAERDVRADLAIWSLQFVVTGNDLPEMQQQISEQAKIITAFLKKRGFADREISLSPITTNDLLANPYQNTAETNGRRFILTQSVELQTDKVDAVADALTASNELIGKGIVFAQDYGGSGASFLFTGLNEIKPEMLEEATRNAKEAAAQFAKNSGTKVGKIRRASQGVFSVQPKVEAANIQESRQIEKKVRVVSTVEYWLK